MNPRRLATLLAIVALAAPGACTRDKPAPAPAGEANAPAPAPDLPIDTMPKVLDAAVKYPEEARARGEQGTVQVKALVGTDGKVTEVSAEAGQAASPVLVEAALAAVRQWTFEPARSGGQPRAVWIVVPVAFRLN